MKVERKEKAFEPVVITLETLEELWHISWALSAARNMNRFDEQNCERKDFIVSLEDQIDSI